MADADRRVRGGAAVRWVPAWQAPSDARFVDVALPALAGLAASLVLVCYLFSPAAIEVLQQAWLH